MTARILSEPSAPSAATLPIQCPNLTCRHAENAWGQRLCDRCQTPLNYSYLWAITSSHSAGTILDRRYVVMAPQIWLDTKPVEPAELPVLPEMLPYLRLHSLRLHLPELRGFYQENGRSIPLLTNVPIDDTGKLYPALGALWPQTTPVRQLSWFWQMLMLWEPLSEQGVASSLLAAENLRVEGWRVRLRELRLDQTPPTLKDLAALWLRWISPTKSPLVPALQQLCQEMQSGATLQAIALRLNSLLLQQSAQLPLRLKVASATTSGTIRTLNEDACYPPVNETGDLAELGIVCDGIGGHAGGEVASQLAVRSLCLQIRALVADTLAQPEPLPPAVIMQQLEAIVRVVNNLIASQNDAHGRADRQRMGTTLVMALQLPQATSTGTNAHELYLVHTGDSRAYWLAPRYCHLLTVDDDLAGREVRMGRSLYAQAQQRSDGGALTQALGTREADWLRPTVQRLILDEDGVLLLCSDGVSDNNLIEQNWEDLTRQVLKGKITLTAAAQSWIELANEKNGSDNATAVLMHCQLSTAETPLFEPIALPLPSEDMTEASKALLYGESTESPASVSAAPVVRPVSLWAVRFGLAVLMLVMGAAGITAWHHFAPDSFNRTIERIFPPTAD
ncbi:serine/threonine-protein phosphatase [Microcoleus sp. FACHB-1515]|uniref:PP2C family protein-serine/threonine phosphatase n=1 Tax=Cyanophyceae TaxID=3028117 RepID=UPI0016875465|nr:PP2C family serine/threonine-protein phosphatase [Microcoleus sp. FACHB-1515]MBD2090425.1 serine/threonine-protein phosphatase [Microcoleus sp. FACHB-1515]